MSDHGEKTQDFTHPAGDHRTQHEIAADKGEAAGKPELEIVAEEAANANAEAKAQARRSPPDIISKKQRKRL